MILEWVDANHKPFDELALAHWNNPELAYKEYEAVRLQMDFLKRRGFSVTQKEGMSTAFMAEWGLRGACNRHSREYDALGGALPEYFSRQGVCLRGCARARRRA